MAYIDFRYLIKPGDLISFSDHPSIISRLISWRTNSKHTHSAMVIGKAEATGDRLLIVESLNCGPTINYLSDRIAKYKGHIWWVPLREEITPEQRQKAANWVWDKLCTQTGYDYHSIWKQLFSKVSIDAAQLFCSEMVQMAWQEAGIIGKQGKLAKALNPGDLFVFAINICCVKAGAVKLK